MQEQAQPEVQQQQEQEQQQQEPDETEVNEREIRKQFPNFPPIFTTYKSAVQQQKDALQSNYKPYGWH